MMKRHVALILTLCVMLWTVPVTSLAAARQMRDGVPVWNEQTVKEYARDYMAGENLETLLGYYDLQVRRYMPMATYETMLSEIEWMTGEFIEFGTYSSYVEPEHMTKTHVLHLCMEKQDLDMYFVHKDKPDDWEVMAIEFVPAAKQLVSDGRDMLVSDGQQETGNAPVKSKPAYAEIQVVVGTAPYELKGILTLPQGADKDHPVPACVLVHDFGPQDMDESLGQTKLFADIAGEFAKKGIATLRYDKRTYSYRSVEPQNQLPAISLERETVQDALSAGTLLRNHEAIRSDRIVLVGHGLGAMLAPKIATDGDGLFCAMVMIAGRPLASDDQPALREINQIRQIRELKIPTYIVQGSRDGRVAVESGVEAYEDALGDKARFVDYTVYRGLNHYLMKSAGGGNGGKETNEEYDIPMKLDSAAARDMTAWLKGLWEVEETE